uniref:Sister chromatid cohesion C-terminal domain-containing protein n=1 Tax=Cacopsylla melanoneura TaxID=428564 RepID=A0A8D8Z3V8_9HEMI
MEFDTSDEEEVSYATFKPYRSEQNNYYDPETRNPVHNQEKLIVEISAHEIQSTENHMALLTSVLKTDHITDAMIEGFELFTLSNMSEKEAINVIVFVINRFQNCRSEDSMIHLKQLMKYLNDVRLLLVILSKKFIAKEFMSLYREQVWKYLKSFLKYLCGLLKLEPSVAITTISRHEKALVHLFTMLARLFQVKKTQNDLRMEFMNYLIHLFFSSTSAAINQAISLVICTTIHKYDWLDIYLYDLFNFDTSDEKVRTVFNFTYQKKKYLVQSTTMLLIQLIDSKIELSMNEDMQTSLRTLFSTCYQIISLALKYNKSVLVSLMKDLNKLFADLTEIPMPGVTVLYYYLLLHIREMIITDVISCSEHGDIIDAYFEMMTQVGNNFKNIEKKTKHLELSSSVIYELLDNVDDSSTQFILMSIMFSTTILANQPLNEEGKAILNYSKINFKESKPTGKSKSRRSGNGKQNDKTSEEPCKTSVLASGKQSDITLCFMFFMNERLNQTILTYCLQSVLTKIKNAQSHAAVARYVKYMSNIQKYCSQSYSLMDERLILYIIHIMYEVTKTCEHKVVQSLAVSIMCDLCSKCDSHYGMFKMSLAHLLRETESSNVFKTLCEFFLCKFQEENKALNLIIEPIDKLDTERNSMTIKYGVIHALLVRLKNPNFKSISLKFFSKLWFEWETQSSKLDHKIEQMIQLVRFNWQDELKLLIKEVFGQTEDMKKTTVLCAKQIVYNVIQNKEYDTIAWDIVDFFCDARSNILVEYFGEICNILKETVTQQDSDKLEILTKIVSAIIENNRTKIDAAKFQEFKKFIVSTQLINVRLDIKVSCYEMMRFFEFEDSLVQKNFSKIYNKTKMSLETLKSNESLTKDKDKYTLSEFYCDAFVLSTWLNNWSKQICKCEELKTVHITLLRYICEFYHRTEAKNDKKLAIKSLGKIHSAFPSMINDTEQSAFYIDILQNGNDDFLTNLVVNNIHAHIKQMMQKVETQGAIERSASSLKCMNQVQLDEITMTANLYLSPILNAYYSTCHPTVRGAIIKLLIENINFGTLVAHQVVGHLIAMLQDSGLDRMNHVYEELEHWNKIDPTLLINHLIEGISNSYKLDRMLTLNDNNNNTVSTENNKTHVESSQHVDISIVRGYKLERDEASPKLGALFELVQKNNVLFLKMLVKLLEKGMRKLNNPGLFVYVVDNLATFPYSSLPQLSAVINELDAIQTTHGAYVLEECNKINDDKISIYRMYLKTIQINLLIRLNTFLWNKYVLPSDLIHNKRHETVKLKIKEKESFVQGTALKSISDLVQKLRSMKITKINKIKTELTVLKEFIVREIVNKQDSENSQESNLNITPQTSITSDQANSDEDMTTETSKNIVGQNNEQVASKPDKTKKQSLEAEHDTISAHKQSNVNDNRIPSKIKRPLSNDEKTTCYQQKDTHEKKTKQVLDEEGETVDENNNMTDPYDHNAEFQEKRSFQALMKSFRDKVKRPIQPHIVEKAKQANIDWMIEQSENQEQHTVIRKSLVRFNADENGDEYISETKITNEPKKTKENAEERDTSEIKKSKEKAEVKETTEPKKTKEKKEERETSEIKKSKEKADVKETTEPKKTNDKAEGMKKTQAKKSKEQPGFEDMKNTMTKINEEAHTSVNDTINDVVNKFQLSNHEENVLKQSKNESNQIIDITIEDVVNNFQDPKNEVGKVLKESKKQKKKKSSERPRSSVKNDAFKSTIDKDKVKKVNLNMKDISYGGYDADEDDDPDFINENRKRTKRQHGPNKKVKLMKKDKEDGKTQRSEGEKVRLNAILDEFIIG